MFMHCRHCVHEMPPNTSPADWSRLEVGWTTKGIQVWCQRHNQNVAHIDFQGVKHLLDSTIYGDFGEPDAKPPTN